MIAAAIFALGAGLLFGLTSHIQKLALATTDDLTGTFISVATTAVLLWLLAPFNIEAGMWMTKGALIFAVCGLFFPAVGQRLQIAAVVRLGPSLTAAIGSFAPLFAIIPAVLILHEDITALAIVGVALLLVGLLFASTIQKAGWQVKSLLILGLPLGAALVRGFTQPAVKIGYGEVNSPFFASLVMASVSTVVIGVIVVASGRTGPLLTKTRGHFWFVINGLVNGSGILALQTALSLGDVTTVAPLTATAPIWTVLMGVLIFRNEQLSWKHGVVSALVFVGSVMIVTG